MAMKEKVGSDEFYLQLSDYKLTFEASSKSKLTNVFYDESNTQVFNIHSGDVTEVIVKSPNEEFCKNFKMKEKGHVVCIKFSPDLNLLSVQRTSNSVDFLTFHDGKLVSEFSFNFKDPNIVVLGFIWSGNTEIVFFTNQGVKLCRVDTVSESVKVLNSYDDTVHWFNYFNPICLLLLNTGALGNTMQLLQIDQSKILKLCRFELDMEGMSKSQRHTIPDRDVVLGVVYNLPRILIMNYQVIGSGVQAELYVYTIMKLSSVKKTHILKIDQGGSDQNGRFALNLVDNLIIVHNQVSKTSMVFDITDTDFEGVMYHDPVCRPKSLKPFEKLVQVLPSSSVGQQKTCELYSGNWVTFQPNIVMDVKIGCLWYVEVNLFGFLQSISNRSKLTSFLLLRRNSEAVIAAMLIEMMDGRQKNVEELGDIFNQINLVYWKFLDMNAQSQLSLSTLTTKKRIDEEASLKTLIDPKYMYTYVLSKLDDKLSGKEWKESRYLTWVMLEYIRSLVDNCIPVEHFLYELLISSLVRSGNYYQLYQLLQYHPISDSKQLACTLLSLENLYPAATQLAIDMFERLGTAREEIAEILISKNQLLSSLRYAKKHTTSSPSPHDGLLGKKYIAAAQNLCDQKLFYTFIKHFKMEKELRKIDWG